VSPEGRLKVPGNKRGRSLANEKYYSGATSRGAGRDCDSFPGPVRARPSDFKVSPRALVVVHISPDRPGYIRIHGAMFLASKKVGQ